MRIQIQSVGAVVKEAKYSWFDLFYKSDGKSQKPKKIMSFNDEYKVLGGAAPGETYDVKLEKDQNGYWQWKDVTKAEEGSAEVASSGASNTTGRSGNWETAEERARRQVLIVRQSCIAQAVAWAKGNAELSTEDVINIAGEFETWVNRE